MIREKYFFYSKSKRINFHFRIFVDNFMKQAYLVEYKLLKIVK